MNKLKQKLTLGLSLTMLASFMLTSCGNISMKKITFYVDDNIVETIESNGNETIELPEAPSKEGYYFVGWYYDNQEFSGDEFQDTKLTENINIYAQFKKYIHVQYEMNGGAYVGTGVQGELPDGDLLDEYLKEGEGLHHGDTVISKDNEIFAGWFDNANFNGDPIRMPYYPTSDTTLYARWAEKYPVLENGMELSYNYSYDDTFPSGYVLTSYKGTENEIDIPATYKGLPIVKIGSSVFSRKNITSVVTHDNLIEISDNAFSSCADLKTVTIADTVTTIGVSSFEWCKQLKDINIGKGLSKIGSNAFMATAWYYALPQGSNYINDTYYLFKNYDADGNYQKLTELTIRDGTAAIADSALRDQVDLKVLNFPESLKSIGIRSFEGCKFLGDVNLPNKLEMIDFNAFKNTGLKSINLPDSIKEIRDNAFYGCKSLKTIKIGKGVTELGYNAFSGTAIEEIDLPENVKSFSSSFSDCNSLIKMTIRCKTAFQMFSLPDSLEKLYVPKETLDGYKECNPDYADRFFAITE